MASIGIHNINETEVRIKHFDTFSLVHLSFTTQGEHDLSPTYENLDFYFDTPEKLQAFMYAMSNVTGELVEA